MLFQNAVFEAKYSANFVSSTKLWSKFR